MLGDKIEFVCKYRKSTKRKENPPFLSQKGGNIEWSLDNAYFLGYFEHFGVSFGDDTGTFL